MSQIEDLTRTVEEIIGAIQQINTDGGGNAAIRELEKLKERVPASVDMEEDSESYAEVRMLETMRQQVGNHQQDIERLFSELDAYRSQMVDLEDDDIFLARIDQEDSDGNGEYDQWAEVISETVIGGLKTGPRTHTTTGLSLWEANSVENIATGTYVLVKRQEGDNLLYVFTDPSAMRNKTLRTKAAFIWSGAFDVEANSVWSTSDNNYDFSGAILDVTAYYNSAGGSISVGSAMAQDVVSFNNHTEGYDTQVDDHGGGTNYAHVGQTFVRATVTAEILKVIIPGALGDFYLRVNSSGVLEHKVENFNAIFFVLVRIVSSGPISLTDKITVNNPP